MKDGERRQVFEALVLQGIWFLMLLGMGKRIPDEGRVWRGGAISYMDEHGNQAAGSREYRRDTAFPDILYR